MLTLTIAFLRDDKMTPTSKLLKLLKTTYNQILGENLIGIYLHGSYVLDSYNYSVSDLDYLVVVKHRLSLDDKYRLMDFTLEYLWPLSPAKGLEFHVLLLENTQHFTHPLPFDFHFSQAHYQEYLSNKKRYLETMCGTDPDLAAHITITNFAGKTLIGRPIETVFSPVPKSIYWDSIYFDVADARKNILRQPTYTILNLCRVLAYQREQSITSKLNAGKWGLSHLPTIYSSLIKQAIQSYTGQNSGITQNFKRENLTAFADYMLKQIDN